MSIVFELKLPARVYKDEDGLTISHCPALDVYSQGENQRRALENLIEAVRLFLVSCYERGTLDAVLKDCGFKAIKRAPHKPLHQPRLPKGYKNISVPMPFSVPAGGRGVCHA
ncbi:MAG: hypothetical protein HY804_10850 [Nitrospinae bacterium]|nr:hypothetical protein [Nitrospinota bacterium]